jgi:hypothetical protein
MFADWFRDIQASHGAELALISEMHFFLFFS